MATKTNGASIDTSAILKSVNERRDQYVSGLEEDFNSILQAIKPLQEALDATANAIHEAVGQWPAGYRAPALEPRTAVRQSSGRTRTTMSEDEREQAILSYISENPTGVNAKQVAESIGVSTATATKTINSLLESSKIVSQGARAGRKLLPA